MTKDLPVNYKLDRSTFWYVGQSNVQFDLTCMPQDFNDVLIFLLHTFGCRGLSGPFRPFAVAIKTCSSSSKEDVFLHFLRFLDLFFGHLSWMYQ